MKGSLLEYLRSVSSIMWNKVYQDKYNTFKLRNRLRKKSFFSAGKESCTVILNRADCIKGATKL